MLAIGIPLFNPLLLASFNPSFAAVRGVKVRLLEYVFVLMITLLTVACLKIVGAVLVEALLLIPAAAARNLIRSMRGFVFLSIAISTLSCIAGVMIPMQFDLPVPSGGAIISSPRASSCLRRSFESLSRGSAKRRCEPCCAQRLLSLYARESCSA